MAREIDVGLPLRPFLYTLDQIADLIQVDLKYLRRNFIYFAGVSTGGLPRDRLIARNIAPDDLPAEWRIAESEFKRWLKYCGYRVYDRSSIRV